MASVVVDVFDARGGPPTAGTDPYGFKEGPTDEGDYIGVEEARGGAQDLVEEHVDPDAVQGKDVTIGGVEFQTWTDAGGDYALSHEVGSGDTPTESWLVVGTAPEATIRDYAARLKGAKVPDAG